MLLSIEYVHRLRDMIEELETDRKELNKRKQEELEKYNEDMEVKETQIEYIKETVNKFIKLSYPM